MSKMVRLFSILLWFVSSSTLLAADGWNLTVTNIHGVENYAGGGFILNGSLHGNLKIGNFPPQVVEEDNVSLAIEGYNPKMSCLMFAAFAKTTTNAVHFVFLDDADFRKTKNGYAVSADKLVHCGLL